MLPLRLLPLLLSALLLGAHFYRAGATGLAALSLATPLLLLFRRRWALRVVQTGTVASGLVWAETLGEFVRGRLEAGEPWLRLAAILGAVALFSATSGLWLRGERILRRFPVADAPTGPALGAFFVAFALLGLVHVRVHLNMILLERFLPGSGWLAILALAACAAWLTGRLLAPGGAVWRPRMWRLFSLAFFAQLLLGLAGFERFLLTGQLHLPVPALIVAGPLYRGEGLFMSILFAATVLLVGPAWCSYLCYIGSWDDAAARLAGPPRPLPSWRHAARLTVLVVVVALALGLRLLHAPVALAGGLAAGFGLLGVGVMVLVSRRKGQMVHCTTWCPVGPLANLLGRLSPWRVRIGPSCTACRACIGACRYDALDVAGVHAQRVGFSCTLCGDCLPRCNHGALHYYFPGLSRTAARATFVSIVVGLHAVFLGVAMI